MMVWRGYRSVHAAHSPLDRATVPGRKEAATMAPPLGDLPDPGSKFMIILGLALLVIILVFVISLLVFKFTH